MVDPAAPPVTPAAPATPTPAPAPATPPVAPAAPATPATPAAVPPAGPDPAKFAGKYATPEALEQGVHEARAKLGLEVHQGPVFGNGGMYADVVAAERGYLDMQTLISRGAPAATPAPTTPAPAPGQPAAPAAPAQPQPGIKIAATTPAADPTVEQIVQSAGLTTDDLVNTYAQSGALTVDHYAALQKQGYGRQAVDAFIAGQVAQVQQHETQQTQIQQDAFAMMGGEQQFNNLLGWALNNLDQPTIDNLNERLAQPAHYKGALEQIQAQQAKVNGAAATVPLVPGQPPAAVATGIDTPQKLQETILSAKGGDPAAKAALAALSDQEMQQLALK